MRILRILTVAVVLVIIAVSSGKQLRRTATRGDVDVYVHGARLLLSGQDIYATPEPRGHQYYNYLPLFACAAIPLTFVPFPAAVVFWCVLNVALAGWMLVALYRAMTGGSFFALPERTRWAIGFFTILLTLRALLYHFDLGQANLVAMSVVVGGLLLVATGRSFRGGALVGLAIVLKVIVAPVVIPFLAQRRMRAVSGIAAGALIGLAVPAVFTGVERNLSYIAYWITDIVLSTGDLRNTRFWPLNMNYSLAAQLYRFFGDVMAFEHDGRYYSVTVFRLPDDVLLAAGRVVPAVVGLAIAAFAWIHRRREPIVSLWGSIALAFCLAPAFSLLSHKHYFVLLLPAHLYVVCLWGLMKVEDRWFRGLVAGSFVVAIMSTTLFDFVGALLSNVGGLIWGSLLLAAAIVRAAAVLPVNAALPSVAAAPPSR